MGHVRCAVDLGSGTSKIERPTVVSRVEESLWPQRTIQGMREGRLYQIVIDRSRSTKDGFRHRERVSLRESDSATGEVLRTIPVQEFTGDHDGAAARAMTLQDGVVKFWMEFWVLE